MSEAKKKLEWYEVETATLTVDLTKKLKTLVDAMEAFNAAKKSFQPAFLKLAVEKKMVEAEDNILFSYNYGKLSIAKAEPKAAKASAKPKFRF